MNKFHFLKGTGSIHTISDYSVFLNLQVFYCLGQNRQNCNDRNETFIDKMDLCLWAKNHGYSAQQTAAAMGLSAEQIQRVFDDIDQKRRTTRYLQVKHLLIEQASEIE